MQPAQPLGFAQGFGVRRINHSGADVMCGHWLTTHTQYISCCIVSVYAMSCIGDGLRNERAFSSVPKDTELNLALSTQRLELKSCIKPCIGPALTS